MQITREQWTRFFGTVETEKGKRVKKIDFKLVANDFDGRIHVTDLQAQEGRITSAHVPANKEMLQREVNEEGETVRFRHFNGVIRGNKKIAVPNRAQVRYEDHLEDRVTGGLDLTLAASQAVPSGGVHYSYLYGTRPYTLYDALAEGDVFKLAASHREVSINGQPTGNYTGAYQIIPAVFGRYVVNVDGSAKLLAEVDTWLEGPGGNRM